MGSRKGRQREAVLREVRYRRKGGQLNFKKMRSDGMACAADVSEAGFGAQGKRGRQLAREKPLICCRPLRRPMLAPILQGVNIGRKSLPKMIANARGYERMSICNRRKRE